MGRNIGKSVSKKLSSKDSQKLLDHAKQSATDMFKTASKRAIQTTAKGTNDLISNKIADMVAKSFAVAKSYNNNNVKIQVVLKPKKY